MTFQVDADGILRVSAQETSTGIEQSIAVEPSHGLTDAQVSALAMRNLRRLTDPERKWNGPVWAMHTGGTYEASLLVLPALWTWGAARTMDPS